MLEDTAGIKVVRISETDKTSFWRAVEVFVLANSGVDAKQRILKRRIH